MDTASGNEINLTRDTDVFLDERKLSNILCRGGVADEPIAVIGITGPARSGKSFLLSYLSRYLRLNGWSNSKWIEGDALLQDGFAWRGGDEPHTQGVNVWKHVLKVPTENGETLNVLLVDSPGLFNAEMAKEDTSKLFTMLMTFCSNLILNIEKRIDERDLESLELFCQYAAGVARQNCQQTETLVSPPFQRLTFVVRDWPYDHHYDFGWDGGKSYVDTYLRNISQAEAKRTRQNIKSTVKSVGGFLMPHPGLNVEQIDFAGASLEISPEFLESVDELARTIFNSQTVEPRLFEDEPMTGKSLFRLIKTCQETLRKGPTLDIQNSFITLARLKATRLVDEALAQFKLLTDQAAKKSRKSEDLYQRNIKQCLQYYDSKAICCGDEISEEYHENCIMKCQEWFVEFSRWNDLQKRKACNSSMQALNGAWLNYKENLKEAMGMNGSTGKELSDKHSKYRFQALQEYRDEVLPVAACDDEHYRTLKEYIDESFRKFQGINDRRLDLVMLDGLGKEYGTEYEAQLFVNYLVEHFREELEKFSHLYIEKEELMEQVQQLQSEFASIFDLHWRYEWPQIDHYRKYILDIMEREHRECMECNFRNKVLFESLLEECLIKSKATYHDVMKQILQKGYCEPTALNKYHRQAREEVLARLRSEMEHIERNLTDDVLRRFEAYADLEYKTFCQLNDCNSQQAPTQSPQSFDLEKLFHNAWSVLESLMKRIEKVFTCVKSTALKGSQSLALLGPLVKSPKLPYVLIALAATAGVVGIGYCVYHGYKWYQERKRNRMLTV